MSNTKNGVFCTNQMGWQQIIDWVTRWRTFRWPDMNIYWQLKVTHIDSIDYFPVLGCNITFARKVKLAFNELPIYWHEKLFHATMPIVRIAIKTCHVVLKELKLKEKKLNVLEEIFLVINVEINCFPCTSESASPLPFPDWQIHRFWRRIHYLNFFFFSFPPSLSQTALRLICQPLPSWLSGDANFKETS